MSGHGEHSELDSKFNSDVLCNFVSFGLSAASGLALNVLIAGVRGAGSLGVFNQVFAIFIVASQMGSFGAQVAALTYIPLSNGEKRMRGVFASTMVIAFIASFLVSCVVFLLKGAVAHLLDSSQVRDGLLLVVPGIFFFSLNKVLFNAANALQAMKAYAFFTFLRAASILGVALWVLWSSLPDYWLCICFTISESFVFLGLLAYLQLRYGVFGHMEGFSRKSLTDLAKFGFKGMLGGVFIEMNTRVDVMMLGVFCSDRVVGVYSFAAMCAEGLAQLPYLVRRNIDPMLSLPLTKGEYGKVADMQVMACRKFLPLIGGVTVAAVALYPIAVDILGLGRDIAESGWQVFAVLAVAVLLSSGLRVMLGILPQAGRPGLATILIAIVAVLNIALNAVLIPLMGMLGAAMATGLAILSEVLIFHAFVRFVFGFRLGYVGVRNSRNC